MRSQTGPNPKILLCKSLPQRLPLGSGKDILNWCFQGYAEFCFSRIYEACVDAECQAAAAAGQERPPPSGDRWLRRWTRIVCCQAAAAAGLERPPPSGDRWLRRWTRIVCCQARVGAGLERPPPSGDRWLRPVDPNRLVPGTRWGRGWINQGSLACAGRNPTGQNDRDCCRW